MDKIKSIQVIPLIRKLNQVLEGSTYRIVSRNTLYVRIETSDGIVGEAFGGDEDIYQQKVVEIANEFLAPRLIGEALQPVERLWEIMFSTEGLPLHNRSIHTLDMVNHAILMQAIAMIDMGFGILLASRLVCRSQSCGEGVETVYLSWVSEATIDLEVSWNYEKRSIAIWNSVSRASNSRWDDGRWRRISSEWNSSVRTSLRSL